MNYLTIEQRLKDILGEEDYKYTDKPHKLLQLLIEVVIDELGNIELAPVGETRIHVQGDGDKTGDFITIRERIAQLKEKSN